MTQVLITGLKKLGLRISIVLLTQVLLTEYRIMCRLAYLKHFGYDNPLFEPEEHVDMDVKLEDDDERGQESKMPTEFRHYVTPEERNFTSLLETQQTEDNLCKGLPPGEYRKFNQS
jgi:hypothetical protein